MFLRVFIFLCFFTNISLQAQNILLDEEPQITAMMSKFTTEGQMEDQIRGWRIQIMTTDDRRKMEASRVKFGRVYPDMNVTWEHVRPYYKVKVGAWEEKRSLQAFLLELKRDFPSAIPVMDDVKKTELVN